ncbi:MAG: ABC transporter permease [Spirochaetes bacterium]|nr:MAG: ABC transporter permease [Spirochaetota bacterium]
MKLYKIALRNIARNKRRSLLSGTAIAIAGFAIVFLFGFLAGMVNDMEQNLWTYMTGAVRVRNAEYDKYERLNPLYLAIPEYESLLDDIKADPGVTALSPRINFPGRVPIGGIGSDEKVNVMGMGVDFNLESGYQDYERTLVHGRLPQAGTREALAGRALAKKLGIGIGGKFTVLSQSGSRGSNAYTFTIVGILALPIPTMEKTMIQVPLDTVQRFLWLPDQVQEIFIKVNEKTSSPKEVASRLSDTLSSDVALNVLDYKEVNGMAAMIDLAVKIYDIIAIVFFLLASTVIINTTIMVIFERMKEIGTLSAMGMTGKQLVKLFFLEALFISIAGALVGIAGGMVLTGYYGKVGFTAMAKAMDSVDSMGIGSVLYPVLNFKSTVMVFIYSLIVTGLATWWPSRRAAKIAPVDALRGGF